MTCQDIQDLILTDYSDGEMELEAKKQIDGHIAGCQACKEFLTVSRPMINQPFINTTQTFEGQEKVWMKIKARIEQEKSAPAHQPVWERWMEEIKVMFAGHRLGMALSVVMIAILTAAVYFRSLSPFQISRYSQEKIQLINDVADEISNGDDEETNYGTDIENYFL